MGGGAWSSTAYTNRAAAKSAAGKTTFDYSATAFRTGRMVVHETLNPKWVAGEKSPFAGKVIRESNDSDEHPNSLPIAVFFDVTGSMHRIPAVLQQKLPKLMTLLLQKGYVEDPHILFGAIGDATSGDRVPLQIGQFESDNRMDENLEDFILEGGGGGGNHESYELAAYYLARHTYLDSVEKRGKKGFAFFIGDERPYKNVRADQVKSIIGMGAQEDVPTEQIFQELQKKFETFFFFAREGSYQPDQVIDGEDDGVAIGWRGLLGQNAIVMDDASAVCELIASTIAVAEGVAELDDVLSDLTSVGTAPELVGAVGKALATVGAGASAVATTEGDLPEIADEDSGAERL